MVPIRSRSEIRTLTPLGFGVVSGVDNMADRVAIALVDLVDGERVMLQVADSQLHAPELRHFPDDDPVQQFELWSSTDKVVELITLRVEIDCACGCDQCRMISTVAWLLGDDPQWEGSKHDIRNLCACLTKSVCECLTTDLPEPTREWFTDMVRNSDEAVFDWTGR